MVFCIDEIVPGYELLIFLIRIQIGKKILGFRNMQEKLEKESFYRFPYK